MAHREDLSINQMTTPSGATWRFGTAAPSTGTAKDGDIVFNTAPAAGGAVMWVCTTPGSPGTWKAVNCAS